jgi:hypothetical protein
MALPASLTSALGAILTDNWSEIAADAAANSGVTTVSFSIKLTETAPSSGVYNYEIGATHKKRTEVSQSIYQKETGTAS